MFILATRRRRAALAAATAAMLAFGAACGSSDDSKDASNAKASGAVASETITIKAGVSDMTHPQIAVLQYMPAKATVAVGQKVRWSWDETKEPHSVTFFPAGQTAPSPEAAGPFFAPTLPTGAFDGTALVNSGLQPLGPQGAPPMEMTFAKAGSYNSVCVIHPQMAGTIVVADAGETAAAVKTRGDQEQGQWLAEGNEAYQKLMAAPAASTKNRDGSTTWKVEMGTTTAHTDILAFAPVPAAVKKGDKVTFVNNSMAPHTASFFNETPPIMNPEDPAVSKVSPGPSPQKLSNKGLYNTGVLPPNAPPGAGPAEAARSFTFSVPTAGEYQYICIYHAPSGMAGMIKAI
jgi:plastocyanin